MRGETMKDKSKKSTYSTTFGVDPFNKGQHQSQWILMKDAALDKDPQSIIFKVFRVNPKVSGF